MPDETPAEIAVLVARDASSGEPDRGSGLLRALEAAGMRVETWPTGPEMPPLPDPCRLVVVLGDVAATDDVNEWLEAVRAAGVPVFFDDRGAEARADRRVAELEGALATARRHEVVGRLVGGVAHDFNNVLSVVSTLTELMLRFGESEDPDREDLEEILGAARRGSELTRQLQAFARPDVGEGEAVDLGARLRGAEKLVRKLLPVDIDVTLQSDSATPEVWVDPVEVDQVIFNLAAHGRWRLPFGGSLRLATETAPAGAPMITLDLAPRPGAPGPTDPPLQGPAPEGGGEAPGASAVGLVAIEEVVRRRGGALRASGHETGARRIEVEFRPVDRAEPLPPAAGASVDGGGRRALVVDADEAVRTALGRALESRGFTVRSAPDVDQALDLLRSEGAEVVLCDAVLPGAWGLELRARADEAGVGAPFVFLSGHDRHPAVDAVRRADRPLLRKPVGGEALDRALAEALASLD